MSAPNHKRLYQVWMGSNRFFCGGRLIFGPDAASILLSTTLIAGPSIAFCCQVIAKIIDHENSHNKKSDTNHNRVLDFPVLIMTIILLVANLVFLFLTSSRDPGIVPRNARPPESDEAFDVTTPSMEWVNSTSPHLRLPRTKDVVVNGFTMKIKYCDTCKLYRPPRASHCSVCNNCVQKFDHHCPWVGQCIGLRNYRFFFLFVSSSTFLCTFIFALSWMNILEERKNYNNSMSKSMTSEVLSLVLIGYTFIAVWFVGGLTVFHFYLISTNQTTYENFRYRYDKKENPYNKGMLNNFKHVFFSKIPPSMNDFRSWVSEETSEVGIVTLNSGITIISPNKKIDLEMGSMLDLKSKLSSPTLLQGLDSGSVQKNSQVKAVQEDDASEQFTFPVTQHSNDQDPGEPYLSFGREYGTVGVARAEEEREYTTSPHQECQLQQT